MSDLEIYERFLNSKLAMKDLLTRRMTSLEDRASELSTLRNLLQEAQDVMNIVSTLAQDNVKGVIEGIVTHALQAVYDDTYSFEMESKISRNQPEMHPTVIIAGHRYSIRNEELGGGVADVVAFALRITLWAMNDPQSDNVLILDEPLKNLDADRMKLIGGVIQELSKSLSLQFIISSHEPELIDCADVSFLVTKDNGVSHVEKV